MTRKHFQKTAAILLNIKGKALRRTLALDFCRMFYAENSRFDGRRFMEACGLDY